jgi:replicative DNA helicase
MESGGPKVPPHSLEAEAAVLGACLLDNAAIDRVVEFVSPEDFYREAHRKIFRAILDLSERSEPADLLTVAEHLRARGELAEVGGAAYLSELADRAISAANTAQYARIVREKATLRTLIGAAAEIVARGFEAREDVDRFLDEAEHAIYQVAERKVKTSFTRVGSMIMDTFRHIEQLYERKEMVTGVPTGFLDLDRMTAGLQPSDLIIVAGRPSMGKTSFCLNIAEHVAIDKGIGVAVFSLEMSKEQLVLRMLCSQARVDLNKVRTGFLSARDFPRLATAAGRLAEAPIYIDDTPSLSALELRAKARRLRRDREANLGLVIVDYLQLMRGSGSADSREQEISEISRSLKALAKELNVPVIALSQLNRQVESRNPPKPRMADLRESGAIEQDADLIAFIYRDEVYNPNSRDEGKAEIIVAKQRNGPTGEVMLAFRKEYTRFENLAEEFEEPPPGEDVATEPF